jgi:DNA-binding CsgD family transcriptional regulator
MDGMIPAQMDGVKLRNFVLTPAEIKIAIALFHGESAVEYARKVGISINTARWFIKQIYSKTNVHRQTELMYLLLKKS